MEKAVCIKTENKTIMDYAERHVENEQLSFKMLAVINYVRIYKKLHLPCELIGALGRTKTKQFKHVEEKSCIRWRTSFPEVMRPSKKSIERWIKFLECL